MSEIVGAKWTVLIVHDLSEGPRRFTELEHACAGISPRTLAERLRWLEAEGIVVRRSYAESPPRVEYELTDKGAALLPVIDRDAQVRARVARLRSASPRHGSESSRRSAGRQARPRRGPARRPSPQPRPCPARHAHSRSEW